MLELTAVRLDPTPKRAQLAFPFIGRSIRGARYASCPAPADLISPPQPYPTRTLALIEGSRERLSTPAPAREFYTAPNFRLALRLADLRQHDVVLLSTRYGLTFLGEQIDPYESISKDLDPWELERWARQAAEYLSEEVYHPDQPLEVRLFVEPWTAAALIRHFAKIRPAWRVVYPFDGMHPKTRWGWLKAEIERATREGPVREFPESPTGGTSFLPEE